MPTTRYALSLADGSLRTSARKSSTAQVEWTEAVLQHILVLNPQLLGVQDQLPLELDGGSTTVSPDQMFIDRVGRMTFVEVKSKRADLRAVAQLLSYAEHWRGKPIAQLDSAFRDVTCKVSPEAVLAASLAELRSWSKAKPKLTKLELPYTCWPSVDSPRELSERYWGPNSTAIPGAPTRAVLIAPSFSEEVVLLAEALAERYVAVELIEVDLQLAATGDVYLDWQRVVAPPDDLEPTWQVASLVWREVPALRATCRLNGWADHMSRDAFSFSLLAVPAVRILISADDDSVYLTAFVPDGWYSGTPKRRQVREALLQRLPEGHDSDRYLTWTIPMKNEGRITDIMSKIVVAVETVLVPAAP